MKEIIKKRKLKTTNWKKKMEFKDSIRKDPYSLEIIALYYCLIEDLEQHDKELEGNDFTKVILKVMSKLGHKKLNKKKLDGSLRYYIEETDIDLTEQPVYQIDPVDFSKYY